MEDSLFWGIPKSAYESADRMLTLARKGGIRQHLLGDTSRIRHGTIEDQSVDEYCNFLQTKLCCEILQLEGADMSAQGETASDGLAAEQGRENNACRLLQGGTEREKCRMDSGMNSIESMYLNYSGLLEEFSEDVIRSRYAFLYKECMEFLKSQKLESEVRLDEVLLMHAVLDYFSDVSRLKKFHHIHHINETKVIAYETFWLLRRKPLQVVTQRQDDFLAFINEKFVFSRLAAFLVGNRKDQVLREQDKKAFMNYLDTLYYFLKYRQYDPKMLELMLLGFRAGEIWGRQ